MANNFKLRMLPEKRQIRLLNVIYFNVIFMPYQQTRTRCKNIYPVLQWYGCYYFQPAGSLQIRRAGYGFTHIVQGQKTRPIQV